MKILLFGPYGQVGWELQRALAPLGQVIALTRQNLNGFCADLTTSQTVVDSILRFRPKVIVNAAAYTDVDRTESELEMARLINAQAPRVMAREAIHLDALLVHYSSDYVFSGAGGAPWQEDDVPEPVNAYGRTKLEGEVAIRESGCCHLIFRTSWVYSLRRGNFLKTMLRLASERDSLRVVNDQIGSPTGAELIADVTAHAVREAQAHSRLLGTYHLSAAGETSWYGYAQFLVDAAVESGMQLKVGPEDIEPVPSNEFPTPAVRPGNSRLDTAKLETAFGLHLPPWEQGVRRVIHELQSGKK